MANPMSPKVTAGATASAIALVVWTLVTVIWPDTFTQTQIAALTGATATILTFLAGYLVKDPRRSQLSAHPDAIIRTYETAKVELPVQPDELDPGMVKGES